MKVALELQPCCWARAGIGSYTWELAKRLHDEDDLEFCGNLFNFIGRNDNTEALSGIAMPIRENRLFPYGIYRRIWNIAPIPYSRLFPRGTDLIISMPLKSQGTSKRKAFVYGLLSGLVEPIGAMLTILLAGLIVPMLPYFLAFAAGAMIYVVVEELIPESQAGEHTNIGTIGVAFGFVVMMVLDVALG